MACDVAPSRRIFVPPRLSILVRAYSPPECHPQLASVAVLFNKSSHYFARPTFLGRYSHVFPTRHEASIYRSSGCVILLRYNWTIRIIPIGRHIQTARVSRQHTETDGAMRALREESWWALPQFPHMGGRHLPIHYRSRCLPMPYRPLNRSVQLRYE